MPGGWYLEHGEKDPTLKIIVGVVAVGAIALGVVFATRSGGDEKSTASTSPTTTAVVGSTTTLPGSTTTSAGASTTIGSATLPTAPIDGAALVTAMPTASELPDGWSQYRDADPAPIAGDGAAYCDQIDEVTSALAAGGTPAYGPRYDLPTGAWFGFDVFAFDSADAATQFMRDTGDDANLCSTAPVTYTRTEADMAFLNDEFSDDVLWNVREGSAATIGNIVSGQGVMRVTVEIEYTTQAAGKSLKVRETIYIMYEQHGRLVTEYWVGGSWDFQGMGTGQPENAHQPLVTELDDAVEAIREPMLTRLTALGAV